MNNIINFIKTTTIDCCHEIVKNNAFGNMFYTDGVYTNAESNQNNLNTINLVDLGTALDAIQIFKNLGGLIEVKKRIKMANILRVMDVEGYDIRSLQEWVDILEGSELC